MKALRLHRTGPPAEVLAVEAVELPEPAKNEVRLRVLAAPINPADLNWIEGTYGVKPELPGVPGIEGCGEVVASRSPRFAPGDRAMVLRRAGTWAEEIQVPDEALWKLPEGLDPLQAAMLKVNPATAWCLLHRFRESKPGDWVVQNAANSAVGRCVIALAKSYGLRTMNFVRGEERIEALKAAGATEVVLDEAEGLERAKEILGKERPMLACNAVGGESALRLMNLLGDGGVHVTYGAMGRRPLTVPNGLLIFRDLQVRGLWVTRWLEAAGEDEIERVYGELAGRMRDGEWKIPVAGTWGLESFREALAQVAGAREGKVLWTPSG